MVKKWVKVATLSSVCMAMLLLTVIPASTSANTYNPWADVNNDGVVNVLDLIKVALSWGTSGTPVTKATIQYDSGWINITSNCGKYFTITHNLNSTNIMVDIQGRITANGGTHQKYLGLTSHQSEWSKTYGGTSGDVGLSMVQTSDRGYAIAGYADSFGASSDVYLVKTDSAGNMQWNKTYGGTNTDYGSSVVQTSDGGYAIAGYTHSFGAGNGDVYLVKTDSAGNMQWNKTYGGTNTDEGYSVIQTADRGYAIAGSTPSFGAGNADVYLVKTDSAGNMQWSKTYGGTNIDYGVSMVQTVGGGYAIAGYTLSFGAGNADVYLVKTDRSGNMQWSRTYGGTSWDEGSSVVQTVDGGYAIAGWTDSFGAGRYDVYLVKTDGSGHMQWSKTYGGIGFDGGYSVVQTSDGGYAIAGYTGSYGAGGNDVYLVKTDVELGLAWTDSTANALTLYRGATDPYWNFVRVRVWQINSP